MSETHFPIDFTRAQLLLSSAADLIQTHPIESSVALAVASLGGYTLRHFIMPSHYSNIDGPANTNTVFGHLFDVHAAQGITFHDELQDKYGSVAKVYGMMGREDLFVSDPRFMHEVLVKGVDVAFRHPQFIYDFNTIAFGRGLLATTGSVHKAQRKMLNPVFTSKHMKSLVPIFDVIAQNMKRSIIKDIGNVPGKEIDVLKWCGATALELIGQAGLGHTFGVLEGIDSEYSRVVKDFLPALSNVLPLQAFFPLFYNLGPAALRRKLAEWAPMASVRRLKQIVDVQDEQAQLILEDKKNKLKSGQADLGEQSNDILSVLLKANMEADEKDRLPEDQLLGQMNTLIFAGHETTSGALTRILELLAMNPTIQDRLRSELIEAPAQLTYDDIHNLPYLDALCREILRLYPPVPFIEREAITEYAVPLRYPIKGKNGEEIREIQVKKGTIVYISIKEANRSKETWGEDADVFRPERWLEKLPESISEAKTSGVYSSMMTFSAGPRACIGFKFSLLELKTVLSTLVRSFKFELGNTRTVWLMGPTMVPYVEGTQDLLEDGNHPTMPLKVSIL
ncbi:Cytochrome P450 3A6 [Rhizoctonia solani AG-1 IB]|uniref:Cytochrome P450 3A6 n=1 Tax=Thanatephorus cucumeris (strain AG1-IB / isolate 7/3/14) TaxID=1108050 RepID=M5BS36_THACB|nr:Cytochrome P450 3A6 [Rhizoctonia solani AG-1 IB]